MSTQTLQRQRVPIMDPAFLEKRTRPAGTGSPGGGRRVTLAAGIGAFLGSISATLVLGLLL